MITAPLDKADQALLKYLNTGEGQAWRWTENGEVLAWIADGGTVVFREELVAILEWLAPRGLPPFDELALLLAACRGHTLTRSEALGPMEDAPLDGDREAAVIREHRRRCSEILAALAALGRWPRELLADARGKAVLAETVFERRRFVALKPAQAREIVAALRRGVFPDAALSRTSGRRIFYPETLTALQGVLEVGADQLARRLSTGLDEPVAPAELPEEVFRPPTELARRLLDQLQTQPEYAGLARVARDVLAALSLPRRLPETDEAAPGGVADLSNRGSLDKLLFSELAHDDLTFAARVALNEALYLRHEPPATPQVAGLALLLDSGVRLWGVPRLFAASVALALGAADARRPALQVWRADGSTVEPVDLLSAKGLRDHLGALSTDAHPGAAMAAFFAALNPAADPRHDLSSTEVEAVLLTHRDTLADPAFRRVLDAQPRPAGLRLLVGTVDRDGGFVLTKYPPSAIAPLCRVTIQLDKIQSAASPDGPAASVPLIDSRLPANLPVILSLPRLPFLLPVRDKLTAFHVLRDGRGLASTHAKVLLSWKDTVHGAEALASGLPPGRVVLLAREPNAPRVHFLTAQWHEGSIPLATYDLDTGELRTLPLTVPAPPVAARLEAGVIFLFYPGRVNVFRLSDGEMLQRLTPEGTWVHGRYYRQTTPPQGKRWSHAAWNGLTASLDPVRGDVKSAVVIFDREDHPGPWVLLESGEVRHLESGRTVFSFNRPIDVQDQVMISRDGHHLRIVSRAEKTTRDVHLNQPRPAVHVLPLIGTRNSLEDTASPNTPQYPVMVDFTRVCVLPEGGLALRSARGRLFEFVQRAAGDLLLQPSKQTVLGGQHERPFSPLKLPDAWPYGLQEAGWPGGSRAFLDSRGLLHLKSSDPTLPEISLILANAPVAVWASDGRMAGAEFFLGPDRVPVAMNDLLPLLRRFCDLVR